MNRDRVTYSGEVLDEVVVSDCMIHLEEMSDGFYWVGIYKGDDQVLTLNIRGDVTVIEDQVRLR